MLLIKDILSDNLFITQEGSYYKFQEDWNTYSREGYLQQILQELKERSYSIPQVWNIWTKRDGEWELDIREEKDKYSCSNARVQVYGEPGTEPTEEQKAQLEAEHQVAKAANDKYWADIRTKKEEDTNVILSSIVGATVIEFIPPSENDDDEGYGESGYLILQAPDGTEIKVTSTHSTWDWGESSSDSLLLTLVSKDNE
jgi:hypothetical protein